jgi:hypothetical protein
MGGQTYNSNPTAWKADTQKYCGLEALVKDPVTGKSMLMYIGDAFDDQYVKVIQILFSPRETPLLTIDRIQNPGYIDIMIDAFSSIHGNPNNNKNDVIKNVEWELTGRVNTQYAAKDAVWPTKAGAPPATPTPTRMQTSASPKPSTPASGGGQGTKCSDSTNCPSGMTCLAPDGVCSTAACNWGYVPTYNPSLQY